ncbi:MAG: hypothetical protein ABII23_08310 [bacterium]
MKLMVRNIICIVLILGIVQAGMYLIGRGDADIYPQRVKNIRRVLAQKHDIIYMGDSALSFVSETDTNRRSIPEMVSDLLNGQSIGVIKEDAFHLEIFSAICESGVFNRAHPSMVIIPINLRSLSAVWHLAPPFQFVKEKIILRYDNLFLRIFFKPLTVFRAINLNPIDQDEFNNTMVYYEGKKVGRVKEFENRSINSNYSDSNMINKIGFFYMHDLSRAHPKIQAMARIASVLKKKGITPVFYVMPIDYQICTQFAGEAFSDKINKNVQLIRSVLADEGTDLLDLSRSLPSEAFDWKFWLYPNEHLNEIGRSFTAKQIAQRIISINSKKPH